VLSFVCEREATTIEPLVNGQQLMAPVGVGSEVASCVNSTSVDSFAGSCDFKARCFALQQACASMDADMCGIGGSTDDAVKSVSLIAPRA
jgi:hypothetical protein